MRRRKTKPDPEKMAAFIAQTKREQAERAQGYRDRALALLPHICGRCGREFAGKDLRELTVHHIDHNHMNNPPDGSNWELLCIHCHDDEHQHPDERGLYDKNAPGGASSPTLAHNPFAGLDKLIKSEEKHDEPRNKT